MESIKVIKLDDNNKNYIYYSIRERQAFIEWSRQKPDIKLTHISKVEGNEKWDVIFKSGTSFNFLTEIKLRKKYYNDYGYENNGWLLEKNKWDELIKLSQSEKGKQNNIIPLYLNFFKDKIVGWDLTKIKKEDFVEADYSINTVNQINNEITKVKTKAVTYLLNKDAIVIENYKMDIDSIDYKSKTIFQFLFPTTHI